MPLTTASPANGRRAVGIDVFVPHVSVAGSYASTVAKVLPGASLPPTAYRTPLIAATLAHCRAVGIDVFVPHVSVAGSYASTVAKRPPAYSPPTAYRMPLTTVTPGWPRAVGIDV